MSQLLPVYYSTLNSKKRKPKKKSKSLLEAERKHDKYIQSLYGKSGRVNDTNVTLYQRPSQVLTEGSTPSLSNKIPVGVAAKKAPTPHNFTVAPAYNKGAYQVISRRDIKDIGR